MHNDKIGKQVREIEADCVGEIVVELIAEAVLLAMLAERALFLGRLFGLVQRGADVTTGAQRGALFLRSSQFPHAAHGPPPHELE